MTQWEYATLRGDADYNPLGAEGWELVAIISRPGLSERAFFKRPLARQNLLSAQPAKPQPKFPKGNRAKGPAPR